MQRAASILCLAAGLAAAGEAPAPPVDPRLYEAMEWRNIGPFRGGRVTAVTGVPGAPHTFFFGASGGGVWKTEDGGATWENVSDGSLEVGSVGAIAVAPSDPNVLYAGTGEGPPRGQASSDGNGVYKSTDGGRTWSHRGLDRTLRIPRIRVHPGDSDVVYVAAQGSPWGPSEERGIYRSRDGGESWERVLYADERTGAVDLSMDPTNPRVLYAALWEHRRQPWKMTSGGPGSGLYKTVDGGESWRKLTQGLPEGVLGKIGVAVSPANPRRVWAIVEAEEGGLYRSDDAGASWRRVNSERVLFARAWYFQRVHADPVDPDTVYVLNVDLMRSIDAGRSFERIPTPHADHHDLWIHPSRSDWMVNGNDGGANVSWNGGRSWSRQDNQPTSQFYRVATDQRFPYHVYGCQQDSGCVAIASRTSGRGIGEKDWYSVGGGESGFVAFDPEDPRWVYAGANMNQITAYDHRTGQARNIMSYPVQGLGLDARDLRYRFNWNAPIAVSPHDPSVLYHAAQMVLRSRDEGASWEEVSPDLTRNEIEKQGSGGGPIMGEAAGGEYYNTISYVVESPHEPGTIWAGTDDGLVWITRDAGGEWSNVTPQGLPEGKVNAIEVSPHDPASAYIVLSRFLLGDPRPYVYRTQDYGKSWTMRVEGMAEDDAVRVVREDRTRRGLLYAGSQRGVYVSFDGGGRWQDLRRNFPAVPVTDLALRENDLVASTEGRGFWILDDLSPLQQAAEVAEGARVHLFRPRRTYRMEGSAPREPGLGRNAPPGAIIDFYLAESPAEPVVLDLLDAKGSAVRSFRPPARGGMNRFIWDLRREAVARVPGTFLAADYFGTAVGYRVPPGAYTVRLSVGGETVTAPLEVVKDPRVEATDEDFRQQEALLARITEAIDAVHGAAVALRDVRFQIEERIEATRGVDGGETISQNGEALAERIARLEDRLIQPRLQTIMDAVNFPTMLNEQLLFLKGAVASADAAPTEGQRLRWQELDREWKELQAEMSRLLEEELARFNRLFDEANVPAVVVPPRR